MSLSKSVVQKKHRLTSSKLLLASFWHLEHWVAEIIFQRINSFLAACGDFCCLLITFANSLDSFIVFPKIFLTKKLILKKKSPEDNKITEKYPAYKEINITWGQLFEPSNINEILKAI